MKSNQTIKNALNTDKELFKDLCDEKGLTQSELFSELIKNYQNQSPNSQINTLEEFALKNEIIGLQTENQDLKNQISGFPPVSYPEYSFLNALRNECIELVDHTDENQYTCIKKAIDNSKLKAKSLELTGTQFIFEPTNDQFKQMHRCIVYDITKGKFQKNNPKLPTIFTENAIKYYIKNEYSHILK